MDESLVIETPTKKSAFVSKGKLEQWTPTGPISANIGAKKVQKKAVGRDVRFAIKDLEMASLMDEQDFMSGNFQPLVSPSTSPANEKPKLFKQHKHVK